MMMTLKVVGLIAWVVGSSLLIVSLWVNHRNDGVMKKVLWTAIICVPVVGWVFYGGMYKPPEPDPNPWWPLGRG
jgi:hypothetical protein